MAHAMAKNLLIKSKETNKKLYDKSAHNINLNINDEVLLLSNDHKLKSVYNGPFTITKIDDFNVTLLDKNTNKIKLTHKNRVIKYHT
jgi:hypothetical protein